MDTAAHRLFGRNRESAELRRFLNGEHPVMMLRGDAGIGKTALLDAFAAMARAAAWRVQQVRGVQFESSIPLTGLSQLVLPHRDLVAELGGNAAVALGPALGHDTANPGDGNHGLWLHADSWQPWMDLLARHGYDVVAPGWPNEPATVAEAREHPERVANVGIDAVVQHLAAIAAALPEPPLVIGHSFGGLIAQKLLDLGYPRAAVAIDPAQIKGVKPLPLAQLRSSFPVLGNPANKKRAVSLTAKPFRYGFGNAIEGPSPTRCMTATPSRPRPGRCSEPRQRTSTGTRPRKSIPPTHPAARC